MEIVQVIYRGRGPIRSGADRFALERAARTITFYLADIALHSLEQPEGRPAAIREQVVDLLSVLVLLKAAIGTRIVGSARIGWQQYAVVPVGGKAIAAAGSSLAVRLDQFLRAVRLRDTVEDLQRLLDNNEVKRRRKPSAAGTTQKRWLAGLETFRQDFAAAAARSLDALIPAYADFEPAVVHGSLLLVPSTDYVFHDSLVLRLSELGKDSRLFANLLSIRDDRDYAYSIRTAASDGIELVDELRRFPDESQHLAVESSFPDQYYTIPLVVLYARDAFYRHFAETPEREAVAVAFRDILHACLRTVPGTHDELPTSTTYKEFPYAVFRSHCLPAARRAVLGGRYLLASPELNLLNLLLSDEQEPNNAGSLVRAVLDDQ
jgi:hypothetical protein